MTSLRSSDCPVWKSDNEPGLWSLKPWSWPLYKLSASCWSTTRRGRLLEPPERAFARMDRLCCFGDSRKTLYSSFGSVGISESSAETGSENQFSDELGQTSPEFCPRAAFGGEFRVAFDQLGEGFTSCLTVLRVAGCHHLEDGAHVGRREWGQG